MEGLKKVALCLVVFYLLVLAIRAYVRRAFYKRLDSVITEVDG